TPVAIIPTRPPTPWQGNTSRVSSSVDFVRRCTARLLTTAATMPITMLWRTETNPAAGVMATRPTTAPTQAPTAGGLLPGIMSKTIQDSTAEAEGVLVVAKASAAESLAASAEPALKPNQPNQSRPVPSSTNGTLAGVCGSCCSWLVRRPRIKAPASAANPADMCTTVPPAKSTTPQTCRKPFGGP